MSACVLHASSKSLQNATEKNSGQSRLGEETLQKFIHTLCSAQETHINNVEAEWNSANPCTPAGNVLDLDSEARIDDLPEYLVGVEDNEISLKLQKPLLTKWWHVNLCATQIMDSYKAWVKLFENLHESRQGDRLSYISQNVFALVNIKKLKCNRALFCDFSLD